MRVTVKLEDHVTDVDEDQDKSTASGHLQDGFTLCVL